MTTSQRKKNWDSSDKTNCIKLIKACSRLFPWDKPYGLKRKYWEMVVQEINDSYSENDPKLSVPTAKLRSVQLITEFIQYRNDRENNEVGHFNSGDKDIFQNDLVEVLAPLADEYEKYLKEEEKRKGKKMAKISSTDNPNRLTMTSNIVEPTDQSSDLQREQTFSETTEDSPRPSSSVSNSRLKRKRGEDDDYRKEKMEMFSTILNQITEDNKRMSELLVKPYEKMAFVVDKMSEFSIEMAKSHKQIAEANLVLANVLAKKL